MVTRRKQILDIIGERHLRLERSNGVYVFAFQDVRYDICRHRYILRHCRNLQALSLDEWVAIGKQHVKNGGTKIVQTVLFRIDGTLRYRPIKDQRLLIEKVV